MKAKSDRVFMFYRPGLGSIMQTVAELTDYEGIYAYDTGETEEGIDEKGTHGRWLSNSIKAIPSARIATSQGIARSGIVHVDLLWANCAYIKNSTLASTPLHNVCRRSGLPSGLQRLIRTFAFKDIITEVTYNPNSTKDQWALARMFTILSDHGFRIWWNVLKTSDKYPRVIIFALSDSYGLHPFGVLCKSGQDSDTLHNAEVCWHKATLLRVRPHYHLGIREARAAFGQRALPLAIHYPFVCWLFAREGIKAHRYNPKRAVYIRKVLINNTHLTKNMVVPKTGRRYGKCSAETIEEIALKTRFYPAAVKRNRKKKPSP